MVIEVIREGNQVPPHYFLKCGLYYSVLRFTKCDIKTYQIRKNAKDEDGTPMIIIDYDIYLRCPLCGEENLLPNSTHQWSTSEREL